MFFLCLDVYNTLQSEVEKNPSRSWLIMIDSKLREESRASGLWAKRIYPIRKDGNLLLCNLDWSPLRAIDHPRPRILQCVWAADGQYKLNQLVDSWTVGIPVRYGPIFRLFFAYSI